ncbi:MAG TPA: S8 family serine peptidase [Arenimonas sp.]|nr:S8 family serine peptidase [Arenimonas sp.]HPW31653.1 S8 family serine peptidase [Arenimonas sp.]
MLKKYPGLFVLAMLLSGLNPCIAGVLSDGAMKKAQQAGSVRVLVMLQDESSAQIEKKSTAQRKSEVGQKISSVLNRLAVRNIRVYHRFNFVPAFAIEATPVMLRKLQADPAVSRIDIDAPGFGDAVTPDESSVLNNVSPLQGLGLDGTGMKVAVIDSGVDTDHVDLQPRLIAQQCFCSNSNGVGGCCPNGQATQSGAGAAEDGHGHGTNVNGIIVGQGSVSPRGAVPGAQLVVVRVLDNNNSFCCSSDVVSAMDWVASNHPDVDAVNLSVGTGALFPGNCDTSTSFTQAMAVAVNNLVANGAVVSSSAGNQGNSNGMSAPACVQNALSVGATWDFTGGSINFLGCTDTSTAPKKPACFSNRSATTDIYGAGAFVTSTGFNGATSTFGGTSMASPMAAACAIALKQAVPFSTVSQRMDAMKLAPTSVTDTVSGRTYPFLDCVDALQVLIGDVAPTLSLADVSVVEGRSGVRIAGFVATLSKPAPVGGVSFRLATTNVKSNGNAAIAGQDYAGIASTLITIPAGQSSASFNVKVFGDTKQEADEIFQVLVSNVNGANIERTFAVGNIQNDDGGL